MTINVVVIVIMMVLAVGFTGMCTFNPGRPENGPVQEVDGRTFIGMEARAADFGVRYPDLPEGWVNNSARRSTIAQQPAPVLGWVTPGEGYLQVTQTGVDEDTAVQQLDSRPREKTGTELIGAPSASPTEASIYTSNYDDVRDLWVVDVGDARVLVTGAAEPKEYKELLAWIVAAEPIQE